MNDRQHIALTEAQIIAAEKGELQLEYRNGEKIGQFIKIKESLIKLGFHPFLTINKEGYYFYHKYDGSSVIHTGHDLFVSEPSVDFLEPAEPKPIYEVGETIEIFFDGNWVDVECRDCKNGHICVWFEDGYLCFDVSEHHRKKQKRRIYISGRITGIDYKEAFALFEAAENELIAKGYDVVNPMKVVPFNKDWSCIDYLSADIKLMEKCTHIYMLSNWRESGGASVEHEVAKWNNFAIIYQ